MLAEADLVLTATRDRRGGWPRSTRTRVRAPSPCGSSPRWPHDVGDSESDGLEPRLAALVRSADAVRHTESARLAGDLDIADPYGEPDQVFDATAREISAAIKDILDVLA